jgi:RNA polymerase sigma-32 factor
MFLVGKRMTCRLHPGPSAQKGTTRLGRCLDRNHQAAKTTVAPMTERGTMTDLSMHGRTCTRSTHQRHPSTGRSNTAFGGQRQPALLDAETEVDLIVRWRDGRDAKALDRLVTSYQCLVNKIAARYRASGVPMEDLIAEGNVGLMHAIGRFEPERGFRLSTYAMWWIRAAISDFALNASSMVRVVSSDRQKRIFFALRRMKARLACAERERVSDESVERLADDLAVAPAEVAEIRDWMDGRDLSINVAAGFDNDGCEEWQDFLIDETTNPEAAVIAEDEANKRRGLMDRALETLDDRERQIVVSRQLSDDPCKLSTLGERYGVSRERVRQIETRALQKLRQRVREFAAAQGMLDNGGA